MPILHVAIAPKRIGKFGVYPITNTYKLMKISIKNVLEFPE
jgi:hypothetical protein